MPEFSSLRRQILTARMVLRDEGVAGLFGAARSRVGRRLLGRQMSQYFPPIGWYTLGNGDRVRTYAGYREVTKPGHCLAHATPAAYRRFLHEHEQEYLIGGSLSAASQFCNRVEHELGVPVRGLRVLEIGCSEGSLSYLMAARGATVVASDQEFASIPEVGYIRDVVRRACAEAPGSSRSESEIAEHVQFIESDAQTGAGLTGDFDLIVSNSVLEHIHNLPVALQTMGRLLRPSGLMVHCFNPFFSETGGHEFCILDFPWGHVRLSPDEIATYFETYRGWERERALKVFHSTFNNPRLSIRQVDAAAGPAGLVIKAGTTRRLCWWEPDEPRDRILKQCQRIYPAVEAVDLEADQVWRVYARA